MMGLKSKLRSSAAWSGLLCMKYAGRERAYTVTSMSDADYARYGFPFNDIYQMVAR